MASINTAAVCRRDIVCLSDNDVCCHDTYRLHLQSVIGHGLVAGVMNSDRSTRNDIYSSIRAPGQEVQSGMRPDCQIVVYIDLAKAAKDGIKFYRSANDVIVSPGHRGFGFVGFIEPQYSLGIWDIRSGDQLPA